MIFSKKMVNRFLLTFFLLITIEQNDVFAQISINKQNIDSAAVWDINGKGKGLLIPRITTDKQGILNECAPNCPEALFIYDATKKDFFYLLNNNWCFFDPFVIKDIDLYNPENQQNKSITDDLNLGGSTAITDKLHVQGGMRVQGDLQENLSLVTQDMNVGGNMTTSGLTTVNVTTYAHQKITANNYSTDVNEVGVNGPVPQGAIVMYFGSSVPSGYVLCDGNNGTPDLRDRMIVAYGTQYNSMGAYTPPATQTATVSWSSGSISHSHQWGQITPEPNDPNKDWSIDLFGSSNNVLSSAVYQTHWDLLGSGTKHNDDYDVYLKAIPYEMHTLETLIPKSDWNTGQTPHSHNLNQPCMSYYVLMFIMKL